LALFRGSIAPVGWSIKTSPAKTERLIERVLRGGTGGGPPCWPEAGLLDT